jgi:hypothetical protein
MTSPEGGRSQFERTAQPNTPTEQHKPQLEGGNGAPGIPPTPNLNERAKPPPTKKSALNRAVERTRDLYERNGWVFLPLGEAGRGSSELQPPEPRDNASKAEGSDSDDLIDDFCFRNPLPTPNRDFPRKGSNSTKPEKE